MTNDTLTPPAAPSGTPTMMLWNDRRIEDYANARFDASFYFEAVQAMCRIRDEYEAQLAAQSEWEPVPDDEYPMVENAENDEDFLYISGNTDMGVCTWVERPIETIMLDLGMKICRLRTPAAVDAGTGAEGEAQP